MRVHDLLRKYNLGIDSLNEYLKFAGLDEVGANSKLNELDYKFICKLLHSNNLLRYDEVIKNMNKELLQIKKDLQTELLNEKMPIDVLGVLQRKYYFKKIKNDFWKIILKNQLLSSLDYSDEAFQKIYQLWTSGELNEMKERSLTLSEEDEQVLYESISPQKDNTENDTNIIDEETEIMSALRNGDGDLYGF